ncbi:hypothetical protein TNCV_193321 [Trichonephila clavipes]|nr:hypothetical protein TNCV_193321 [Trichonephila clavipes]
MKNVSSPQRNCLTTEYSENRIKLIVTHYTPCKEQLPAPGNRSNKSRYREKDLATTEEKKVGTGEKREGGEEKAGVVKK